MSTDSWKTASPQVDRISLYVTDVVLGDPTVARAEGVTRHRVVVRIPSASLCSTGFAYDFYVGSVSLVDMPGAPGRSEAALEN